MPKEAGQTLNNHVPLTSDDASQPRIRIRVILHHPLVVNHSRTSPPNCHLTPFTKALKNILLFCFRCGYLRDGRPSQRTHICLQAEARSWPAVWAVLEISPNRVTKFTQKMNQRPAAREPVAFENPESRIRCLWSMGTARRRLPRRTHISGFSGGKNSRTRTSWTAEDASFR